MSDTLQDDDLLWIELKACAKCKTSKPLCDFNKNSSYRDGLNHYCRECSIAAGRATYERTGHRKRAKRKLSYDSEQYKDSNLRKQYCISLAIYKEMLARQDWRCAICGAFPNPAKSLAVDHNHDTGQVRALLCGLCNTGLGAIRESVEILEKMKAYILKWNAVPSEAVA